MFTKMLSLFLFFLTSSSALNISINVSKEAGKNFSVLHIKEDFTFKCLSEINEFNELKQVQCVFPREPKEKFKAINTDFFQLDSFTKNKKYYIRVFPVQKMKLIPIAYTLYSDDNIFKADTKKSSKHWSIIGYKNKLPFIKIDKTPPLGLNFPIQMPELKLPSVGALDISGNPIRLDKVKDVSAYMKIKSAYEAGNYKELANDVDNVFKVYPNTIFRPELLLYKIRGYHKTDESEALLVDAKEFLWEYSSDNNVPEVLAYTANAYSNVGLKSDSDYFFERLFKEFPESKFAALGMVFLGDKKNSSGKAKEAQSYYEKALYRAKDVEIASMAAIRLARINLSKGKIEKSAKLFEKIIEGNKKYLIYDISENYESARAFVNRKKPQVGADIIIAISDNLSKNDDRYEMMMKDIGVFLAQTDDKPAAYKALKRYQQMYKDNGDYVAEVQEALDSLFYTSDDVNQTALLAQYENLEEKYKGKELGTKASIEKARLYFKEKQYQKVLDLTGLEKEEVYEALEKDSALALAEQSLENNKCAQAIYISQEYNLSIDARFDNKMYICSFKTGNYLLAQDTARKHLKDKNRLLWLYNYAKTLNKLGKYKKLTEVSADIVTLSEVEKTSKYDDILHDTFYAYARLKDQVGMITTVKELERRRGLIFDDIEIYTAMVKLGLKNRDDIIIDTYASKVMKLQEKTKTYTQSPFVEFAKLQVLKVQRKDKEQMQVLNKLIKVDLSDKDKSRVQYMFGSLLMKENKNKEAISAFEASIRVDEKSAWASLSKDALELLK